MDFSKKYDNPCPESSANILSKAAFLWSIPLFRKGLQKDLEIEDLYNARPNDGSEQLTNELEKNWYKELKKAKQKNRKPKLLRAIYATYWKWYSFWGLMLFIQAVFFKSFSPVVLAKVIEYFNSKKTVTKTEGYIYASLLMVITVISTLIFFQAFLALQVLGMRARVACCSLMYRKVGFINIILCMLFAFLGTPLPIFLGELIRYFQQQSGLSKEYAYTVAVLTILFTTGSIWIYTFSNFGLQTVGMRVRVSCCSLIYRKMLRLDQTALGEVAVGKIVNLMSNDVNRFDQTPMYLHYIWIMPIQLVTISYFMWESVGWAAFGGILVIFIQAVPVQGIVSRRMAQLRMNIAKRTDERIRLMNEIIGGVQVIKMYAWEKPFEAMVRLSRKYEIDVLLLTSYFRGFSMALMVYTERLSLYVTVIMYVYMGNNISGDKVFSMAQFFNTLQLYLAIFFPQAIIMRGEALVSVKRIEEFLQLEENKGNAGHFIPAIGNGYTDHETKGEKGLQLENVTASWVPQSITPTLCNINLNLKPGQLCSIIGPVGSGKSSILHLLLKELPLTSGSMSVGGKISFSSQEPWLFEGNVRNNILFGQPYNRRKYNETVNACALVRDFEQFPHDDKTLVGDRGNALSGGQKARVNLARAVYREADIYLFDDPLSAVDTHVGKHLFEKCIKEYLRDKTRILVTHQLQFVKDSDLIIALDNGKITRIGTWDEISKDKALFECIKASHDDKAIDEPATPEPNIRKRLLSEASSVQSKENDDDDPQETAELMEKGAMAGSIFWQYLRAGGSICFLVTMMFFLILSQTCCSGSDFWVTRWTNTENIRRMYLDQTEVNSSEIVPLNLTTVINGSLVEDLNVKAFDGLIVIEQNWSIYIYTVLIALSVIITTLSRMIFYKMAMSASMNLHDTMFVNILQATMRFFDTNPSGRILNRFSKDMGAIDELLPKSLLDAIQIFLVMFGILTMVALVNPYLIALMLVMAYFFNKIRLIYMKTAQGLKRLEGITRSPAFSQVSSSLDGITTIRACGAQGILQHEFDNLQDVHTGAWYLTVATSLAFGFWLDCISITFLGIVTFSFLIMDDGTTFSGNVGLAISQTMILTGMLQYGMRQTAEVMNQLTSVERVLQYTKLDKEGPFESEPNKKPRASWPETGKIDFKHTYLSYSPETGPVLKDLNINITPGDKVGIVGRTGAGKSSLISALFRLAPLEGEICIDDIGTQTVGLTDLRTRISIIPQTPVLFSATLRYNLDPFNTADDAALWQALDDVELKEVAQSLDFKVNEGGSNFSAGQRQLLCLARAIVRNNKVLVLDEATANVDLRTDALIQTTIRTKFTQCTVLTIAHRLNTIMDSDKVLVMENGRMVEYDHPHLLLQNPEGYFTKMLEETNKSTQSQLRQVASNAFANKFGGKVAK